MSGDTVTPGQLAIYAALSPFIQGVTGLPNDCVIQGIQNRASLPLAAPGFVMMQAITRDRLRTNIVVPQTANPPALLSYEQGLEMRVQLDCYGPSSGDWADMLTTLLRSDYGVQQLKPNVTPLYADSARLIPLDDTEMQYEERWSIDGHFQYNPVTTVPQDYADVINITLINVQEAFK